MTTSDSPLLPVQQEHPQAEVRLRPQRTAARIARSRSAGADQRVRCVRADNAVGAQTLHLLERPDRFQRAGAEPAVRGARVVRELRQSLLERPDVAAVHAVLKRALRGAYATTSRGPPPRGGRRQRRLPAAAATPGTAAASAMPTTAMLPATARLIRKNLVMRPTPSPLRFCFTPPEKLAPQGLRAGNRRPTSRSALTGRRLGGLATQAGAERKRPSRGSRCSPPGERADAATLLRLPRR